SVRAGSSGASNERFSRRVGWPYGSDPARHCGARRSLLLGVAHEDGSVRLLPAGSVVAVGDAGLSSHDPAGHELGALGLLEVLHALRRHPLERLPGPVPGTGLAGTAGSLPRDELALV